MADLKCLLRSIFCNKNNVGINKDYSWLVFITWTLIARFFDKDKEVQLSLTNSTIMRRILEDKNLLNMTDKIVALGAMVK